MLEKHSKKNTHTLENTQQNTPKKQKTTIIEQNSKNNNGSSSSGRMIRLYCPVVSKVAEFLACGDQRLDLGTIARIFGIEPASLKLNGHFISRGVDLVATCVTWNSLFSFFGSKGLSTGLASSGALIVHGKVAKTGGKRIREQPELDRGIRCTRQIEEGVRTCRYTNQQDINSPSRKKVKESNNASERDSDTATHCDTRLKRSHSVEDICPFKRVRISGSHMNENCLGVGVNEGSCIRKLHCGFQMSENLKRLREDEVILAAPCKRTR